MKTLFAGAGLCALMLCLPAQAETLADLGRATLAPAQERPLDDLLGPLDAAALPPLSVPGISLDPGAPPEAADWGDFDLDLAQSSATPVDSPPAPAPAANANDSGITPADPPADWIWFDMQDSRIALPPGWKTMEEKDGARAVFVGDASVPRGQLISVALDDVSGTTIDGLLDDLEDEGGSLQARGDITLGDEVLDWADVTMDMGGIPAQMRVYMTRSLLGEDAEPINMAFGAVGGADPVDPAIRDTVLASLRLGKVHQAEPAAPPTMATGTGAEQVKTLFGTLVTVTLPAGWSGIATHESGDYSAPGGALRVRFLYGDPATKELAGLAPGASAIPTWQGNAPAQEYGLNGTELTVWDNCPEPGMPLVMLLSGPAGFQNGLEYREILTRLQITMPKAAAPCGAPPPQTSEPQQQAAAPGAPVATPQPPAPPAPDPAAAAWGEDVFETDASGYTLYRNARHGVSISYPGTYFQADPPPANGDGRSFRSVDGQASFYVFAQYDALDLGLDGMRAEDRASLAPLYYDQPEQGAYQMAGARDGKTVIRRVIRDLDGLTRTFEISYPPERESEFSAVVAHMAGSFGPPPDLTPQTMAVPQPPQTAAVPQPPAQAPRPITQPPAATPPRPASPGVGMTDAPVGALYTPQRGSAERSAIMDAARVPIVPAIGQHVIFVVDVLNSDGHWAYLQATPVNADGTPLNWLRTNYASDWAADAMSDVVMVLLRRDGAGWQAIDWIVGPTDVAWLEWVPRYMLPVRLFQP
ncbi:hypothetical protein [Tropicibacter oceani]|uniref:Uncharacterized protein n=1 Tax=Tropicibacter oceani TaxID=3058420 RepID=A0ABY8QJD4_9RHOB|nr:hypothetical protein [Tropicibacter oceani]WGW04747.1 hypothetical protein QF118_04130 [Tropicibacter oceani]